MLLPVGGVVVGEPGQGGGVGGACHAHTAADGLTTIVRLLAGRVAPPPPSETNINIRHFNSSAAAPGFTHCPCLLLDGIIRFRFYTQCPFQLNS